MSADLVEKHEALVILQHYSEILGVDLSHRMVGSLNRKALSGDIDVLVTPSESAHIKAHALEKQIQHYVSKTLISLRLTEFFNKTVQLDFIVADNLDWASFYYDKHSLDNTEFKGADRACLLSIVAKHTDNNTIIRNGVHYSTRWKLGSNGLKRIIRAYKITQQKESTIAPDYDVGEPITDPLSVVNILFGGSTSLTDTSSVELILDLINKHKQSETILAEFATYLSIKSSKRTNSGQRTPKQPAY